MGDIGVVFSLATENWNPSNATEYIYLYWSYDGSILEAGSIKEIVLTLVVNSNCPEIPEFNFNIVIVAS